MRQNGRVQTLLTNILMIQPPLDLQTCNVKITSVTQNVQALKYTSIYVVTTYAEYPTI